MSVVAFAARPHPTANQPQKDLYEIGEIPPLGHVPKPRASSGRWAPK
jgi:crotonyl-CoA carboxylase/reductase